METDTPLFPKLSQLLPIKFMNLFGLRNRLFNKRRRDENETAPEEIDGAEKRVEPLSTHNITYYFCSFGDLKKAKYIQPIAYELGVPEATVIRDIKQYFDGINDDTICCLEYPYIEEYYRDTYYSFYARKHKDYNRHCYRISFFSKGVTEDNFFSISTSDLNNKFLGYVVLRPTPRRIIGYSFLSPKLTSNQNIAICICRRLISVMGRSMEVTGFPFMSHDGEAISCSENSIILIFDYFSRRYNNYARVLPSQISNQLSSNNCRNQPSEGLAPSDVVQMINNLGMTTRIYKRNDGNDVSEADFEFGSKDFEKYLKIFVESGIPVYVSSTEHAYLLIGRENKLFEQGAAFVSMDGTYEPYHLIKDITNIDTFIVPMPDNILLDAQLINPDKFSATIESLSPIIKVCEQSGKKYYHRVYLTTSRSFKKHIVASGLEKNDKILIACIAMPKFVWVCESIPESELQKTVTSVSVESIGIYDATDYPTENNHLLFAKTKNHLILPTTDNSKLRRKKYAVINCTTQLPTFQFNLKGDHTEWQG